MPITLLLEGAYSPSENSMSNKRTGTERLPWAILAQIHAGEWVELVDFAWRWEKPNPSWATVRHHSSDRRGLMEKIRADGEIQGAVVLFVGAIGATIEPRLAAAI